MGYHLMRVNVRNYLEILLLSLMKQGKIKKEHATRLKSRLIKMLVKEPGWKWSLRNIWRELDGDIKVDFKTTIYEHMGRTGNQPLRNKRHCDRVDLQWKSQNIGTKY